jgi:hypothetical protein
LSVWFSNWWLLSLVSVIFLVPWPAPGRVYFELRGYATDIKVFSARKWNFETWLDEIVEIFCGPSYSWMSWNEDTIRMKFILMRKRWRWFPLPMWDEIKKLVDR